ncbi:tetratricopeptide repeat-containing glycosyltransferase family protein [Streptomyces sp. N2-109]|uniref:Tetratricopeptide repeat-containing glycosyltransferase family protein n=1 Tax=Streptomyces gossypii TaxID=2883101 RepID=A0ABT2K0J9_9ACTN|nr:tetratricopeptide repeat-containing glycosyltransferase family protein [Streptomyces gossypii]MCT2592965.1 tetratricopeptide repeat-containing glycosyltransferase family protein [Streptomyces gossypii]MCT2593698.1 tetratricopeptide repeat-containing glycosyltransferase family protein [Streptomyces gossypii]
MTDPTDMTGPRAGTAPRAAAARTGGRAAADKRRIALACHTDRERLPGLLALLRSLALTNPWLCEDFLLLHDGLSEADLDAARRLHPRLVPRRAASRSAYLRTFQGSADGDGSDGEGRPGYDTVLAFTTGMVVLGDIGELVRLRYGAAAVPQPVDGGERAVREDGLLVLQRDADTTEAPHRPLDARFDFLVRRLYDDTPVPGAAVVLNFGEADGHHPWTASRAGYGPAQEAWRRFDLTDEAFHRAYCALRVRRHPDYFLHCVEPLLRTSGPSINLARDIAGVYLEKGRYDEAVEVLSLVADRAQADQPRFHETFGTALLAVSRHEEAETRLLLATAEPTVAARAFRQLGRLAWLRGDDAGARAYAREGLDSEPTHGGCRSLHLPPPVAESGQQAPGQQAPAAEQFAHVALFSTGQDNAGDKVLPEAVRMCLDSDTGPRRWHPVHVHRLFDERALEQVNARRGVIIGGGGLFLPDTWPNGNSAWQWNVPDELLARITVPLAVFAVGYNAFDGQEYGRPRFIQSLRTLVEQSAFFGLRNHGSVRRVRELLPSGLRDRVRWQPCPTTVARQLDPGWRDPERRADTVLLNCAYDRAGLRFGHDYGHFLGQLAEAVRKLSGHAEVRYAAHMPADERLVHDMRREHGITLPVDPLYDFSNDEIRDHYARTRLVIGMRGHATMIPFGCGTPVLSLISHPKLAYFLDDIGRPEWGVSVHDRELGALLTERAVALLESHPNAVFDVHARQRELWRVTEDNLAELTKHFA